MSAAKPIRKMFCLPKCCFVVISGMFDENVKYCRIGICFQTMTENAKIRAAAIGVGSLGRHHARNYAQLALEGRIEFIGACDIDQKTLNRFVLIIPAHRSAIGVNSFSASMSCLSRHLPSTIARSHVHFLNKAYTFSSKNRSQYRSTKLTR